ncbi:fimbrial protein [Parabacteroides sp. APC149_11_2_Y6]
MEKFRYRLLRLLPAGFICLLLSCSNEVPMEEEDNHSSLVPEGKVMLTMAVRAATPFGSGDSSLGTEAERTINSLYVFVFNIGTSQYCEAKRFSTYDMEQKEDGSYTFSMQVTPGNKRFYLVANPLISFRDDLAGYTQAELQDLKTITLDNHADGVTEYNPSFSSGHLPDQMEQALNTGKGIPMSMSVTGRIELDKSKPQGASGYQGNLTLDDGSANFNLVRAVAKIKLVCHVQNYLYGSNFSLETLEIIRSNRSTFLFPKYDVQAGKWVIDFPFMMEGCLLNRTVGFESGKLVYANDGQWREFERGTHYFYENYFGPTLPDDTLQGLIDETKYTQIHVVCSDGRDKIFTLPYLKRNDFLIVTINITPSMIICDVSPWEEESIYPDYKDEITGE